MASLVFGVLEVAYSDAHGTTGGPTTTGDVADILEKNYGVMQTFYDLRKGRIAEYLADGMATVLQDLVSGRTRATLRSAATLGTGGNAMYDAAQRIEHEFRAFLDANEMNKISVALAAPGILNPNISAAAAQGVSHRKKHPYAKKNKPRPAFIDTGLYRASFRALVRL